jgi:hypothetical protein
LRLAADFKEPNFEKKSKGTPIANSMTDLEHKEIICVINLLQLSGVVKSNRLDVLPDPHSEEAMKKKDAVSTATQNAPPRLLLLTT